MHLHFLDVQIHPPKSRWIFPLEIFSHRNGNFRHSFALHKPRNGMALSCLSRLIQKSSFAVLFPFHNSLSFVQVLHCDVSEFMCVFRFFFSCTFFCVRSRWENKHKTANVMPIPKCYGKRYLACIFHAPTSTSAITDRYSEKCMLLHSQFTFSVLYHNRKCVRLSTLDASKNNGYAGMMWAYQFFGNVIKC